MGFLRLNGLFGCADYRQVLKFHCLLLLSLINENHLVRSVIHYFPHLYLPPTTPHGQKGLAKKYQTNYRPLIFFTVKLNLSFVEQHDLFTKT